MNQPKPLAKPLKSALGQPAEGEDRYFPRPKIVKKIRRQLNRGENLLLSAPRRIGKSSILKHIKQQPEADQIILYISVMSVDSSQAFFKQLFNELIKNRQIFDGITGYLAKAGNAIKARVSQITDVSLTTGNIKLDPNQAVDYYAECERIFLDFDQDGKADKKIIVFIDEFPDALNNILEQQHSQAIHFLQQNRDLRMRFSQTRLQFVYTGSTGLKNVVKKLDKLDLINDIVEIKVPPLSQEEAKELIWRLTLGFQRENPAFALSDATIEHILNKISWRLPYYMQIIVYELFEHFEEAEDEEQQLDEGSVDLILSEMVKSKSSHADYFENWKRRLKTALKHQDHRLALEVLNYLAKHPSIEYSEFFNLAVKHAPADGKYVLDVLEHDGYISEDNKKYAFNSVLLQQWWALNVAS